MAVVSVSPSASLSRSEKLLAALFHAVSVKRVIPPPLGADLEMEFGRDYRQTVRMFEQLRDKVDVTGKSVLDIGCGFGPTCIYAGLKGARRVVGVDVLEERISFARRKVEREFSELTDVVEFICTRRDLREVCSDGFDIVVSKDSFEHYDDPAKVVDTCRTLLKRDGLFVVKFGPLWKSPWGGHIWYLTPLPWAQLLFPEHLVMRERRRVLPHEDCRGYEDFLGGLNKMTVARFRDLMESSGLECVYFGINVSSKRLMAPLRLLSKIPVLEEYLAHNVCGIWRKA
jgi:SAM-dependent methyltransferase